MNARCVALAFGIIASSVTDRADAQADRPVFVTVVGHGAIRFRLAVGGVAPCDSGYNRMLFDGRLEPGRYAFATGANVVCYQHTAGALREVDWSASQVVPTLTGSRFRRWPTEITVSTD